MLEPFSTREYARAVLGRDRKRVRRVAVLSTYLDGGGSVCDPTSTVFSIGGYLATDDQWESFESEWQTVLDEFEIPALHMKELAHFRKIFAKWRRQEKTRAAFLSALADVIQRNDLEGFAYSVNMAHYRQVDKRVRLSEAWPPYALTALWASARIRDWQRRYRPKDSLLLLFELGDAGQGPFKHKMENDWEGTGMMKPAFIPKQWCEHGETRHVLPFQAADFIAYETNKMLTDFFTDGKRRARQSIFRLVYRDGVIDRHPTNGLLTLPEIEGFARACRLSERKGG